LASGTDSIFERKLMKLPCFGEPQLAKIFFILALTFDFRLLMPYCEFGFCTSLPSSGVLNTPSE
jgi:hypothetical protein